MKQIRLLPVVIVAACALLLLKGVGIMTNGGYVLVGATTAAAAGGGGEGGKDEDPLQAAEDAMLTLPDQRTMEDTSPVLDDAAPTLPLGPAVEAHGDEPAPAEEAAPPAEEGTDHAAEASDAPAPADAAHGEVAAAGEACPPADAEATAEGHDTAAAAEPAAQAEDELAGLDFINPSADCVTETAVNEHGDALPTIRDGSGHIVPLESADGPASEDALLERLSERRDDLDAREAELEMRLALVEAAEKRIEERAATLEALEARINAMVDEKRTLEEAQFVAVVAMYETMKPKDAAAIFDELDMPVLLRVARAINPRKMAPIMAKMDPLIAKDLTAGLAVDRVEPTIDLAEEDLASLPQIIGQ